ncbi:hypothetical protein J7M22_06780 [Candidatus Poribacteria bacterium]|nr:hypothetical protein [Candidatus Poribacteria bacterium]
MRFTVEEFRDLVRVLEEHPEWRSELRRVLLTDELLKLPQVVSRLAEEQHALAAQVRQLAEEQRALAAQVRQLAEDQRALTAQVRRLTQKVDDLVTWQRGEAGRREGERYERMTVRRGPVLFSGGMGGSTDNPVVQRRLVRWLKPIFESDRFLETEEDPTLADLIWWKGDRVAVVEISLKVNGRDVLRASRRAEVLSSIGVNAFPVVIGEDWAGSAAKAMAEERGVEWMIAGMSSEGLISFRRLSHSSRSTSGG